MQTVRCHRIGTSCKGSQDTFLWSNIGQYSTLKDKVVVSIHPASVLKVQAKAQSRGGSKSRNDSESSRFDDFVIYSEMVETTKKYIRDVTVVEPEWLREYAPSGHYVTRL
eukprot:SAG31_NODE_4126_length_3560_cov_2.073678_6_plen_110_part_00